jgi:hypothetical protein
MFVGDRGFLEGGTYHRTRQGQPTGSRRPNHVSRNFVMQLAVIMTNRRSQIVVLADWLASDLVAGWWMEAKSDKVLVREEPRRGRGSHTPPLLRPFSHNLS